MQKVDKKLLKLQKKKPARKWGEKKFQLRDANFNKPKSTVYSSPKKTPINRNFDIRKMAEERATKRFKNLKEDILQQKKSTSGKEKSFTSRREKTLTLSKALDHE